MPLLDLSKLKDLTIACVPGTGRMGGNLARLYACQGFKVHIGSRDAAKAKALAAELRQQFRVEEGGGALRVEGGSNAEAADAADVVFWCIVGTLEERHTSLRGLQEELKGKCIIDVTNIMYTRPESDWGQVSSVLDNKAALGVPARWTCAWKSTFWKLLEEPPTTPLCTFVCGDEEEAVALTCALVEQIKPFKAVKAGPLKNSKIVELLGPPWIVQLDKLNCRGGMRSGWQYGK